MNFMMIGNPGVGKSTLMNGLVGELVFRSGVSMGTGMTFKLDIQSRGGNKYFDTPGLSDIQKRQEAARAIEDALKQSGKYKILFVIYLQSGRIVPEDVATIQCVLNACGVIGSNYGIIINKVPAKGVPQVQAGLEKLSEMIFVNNGRKAIARTQHFFVNPKDSQLEDEDNVFKPVSDQLRRFVNSVPTINIKPTQVDTIDTRTFDDVKAECERQMGLMRKRIDDQDRQHLADRQRWQEDQARQRADFEAREKRMEDQRRREAAQQKARDRKRDEEHKEMLRRQAALEQQRARDERERAEPNRMVKLLYDRVSPSAQDKNDHHILNCWSAICGESEFSCDMCYYMNSHAVVSGPWATKACGRYVLNVKLEKEAATMNNIRERGFDHWGACGSQRHNGNTMTWSGR